MCGTPSRGFLIGLVGLAASFTAWATPVDAAPDPAIDVIVRTPLERRENVLVGHHRGSSPS